MWQKLIPTAVLTLALSGLAADKKGPSPDDQYKKLTPDSEEQPGVPKGEVTEYSWNDSKIYPGTVRKYAVYVPKQYSPAKPACVYVSQDGVLYKAPTAFDNLIHKKQMPVTIGIFIRPGDIRFTNSQFRTIPSLLHAGPGCVVDIHPEDALRYDLTEGDPVRIESPKGAIEMEARISTTVRPGMVRLAWGWGEYDLRCNLNTLTEDDRRGRHTTTRRELIVLPGGGLLIDTPGMRELQLWGEAEDAEGGFEEIERLATGCRFRDCSHQQEPGCAVRQALGEGAVEAGRFENYLQCKRELAALTRRRDEKTRSNSKARWRKISLLARNMRKDR